MIAAGKQVGLSTVEGKSMSDEENERHSPSDEPADVRRRLKTAEAELEAYRNKCDTALDAFDGLIYTRSRQGAVSFIENRYYREFSRSPDAGSRLEQIKNVCFLKNEELFADNTPADVFCETGRRWYRVYQSHLRDSDTGPAVLGFIRDITAEKAATTEFARSKQWHRIIFDGSRDAILIADSRGRFVDVNEAAVHMSGYAREELLEMAVIDLHDVGDQHAYRTYFDRVMAGEAITSEADIRRKNGSRVSVEFSNRRIVIDGIAYMHTVARDITERKMVETALRASEERFRGIFEHSLIGLYRTTPGGRILMVNPSLLTMLGYDSLDELTARNLEESGYEPNYPRNEFKKIMDRDGFVLGLESGWLRKDGTVLHVRESARAIRDESGHIIYYEGTVEDITRWKQAEASLQQREQQFRRIVQEMPLMIDGFDADGNIVFWNAECERVTGYNEAEIVNNPGALKLLYGDSIDGIDDRSRWGQPRSDKKTWVWSLTCRDGSQKTISWTSITEECPIPGWTTWGVGLDITEQKRAEDLLRASEEHYRQLVENSHNPVFYFDRRGMVTSCNKAFERNLGYRSDEVINRSFSDFLLDEGEIAAARSLLEGIWQGEKVINREFAYRTRDGQPRYMVSRIYSISDAHGEIRDCVWSGTDITDRKLAEEALRKSEDKYRTLFNSSPMSVTLIDSDGTILDCNEATFNIPGLSRSAIVGRKFFELDTVAADELPKYMDLFNRLLAGEELGTLNIRFTLQQDELWLEMTPTVMRSDGQITGVIVITRDITERRCTEEALKASEEFNRAVVENSPLGVSVRSRTGRLLGCNQSWQKIFGFSDEMVREFMERERTELKFDEKDAYLDDWQPRLRRVYDEGGHLHVPEAIFNRRDSNTFSWVSQHFYAVMDRSGQVNRVVIITEDITERKLAEEALRESEERYRILVETMPDGLSIADQGDNIIFVNDKFCELTGYPASAIMGMAVVDLVAVNDKDKYIEQLRRRQQGVDEAYEIDFVGRDGRRIPVIVSPRPIFDIDGRFDGSIAVFKDIAVRKRAEEALKNSEREKAIILDSISEVVSYQDPNMRILWANRTYGDAMNLRVEKLVGQKCYIAGHHREKPCDGCLVKKAIESGRPQMGEMITDDKRVWLVGATPIKNKGNSIVGVVKTGLDITDRKQFEIELIKSEEKYRLLVESAGQVIISLDREGRSLFVNNTAADYLRDTPENIIGQSINNFLPAKNAEELHQLLKQLFETGGGITLESKFDFDDRQRWLAVTLKPMIGPDGDVASALLIARNITEKKRAEARDNARLQLFDNLRHTNRVETCLSHACQAVVNQEGYDRAAMILYSPQGTVEFSGRAGFEAKAPEILYRLPADELTVDNLPFSSEPRPIGKAFFITADESADKADIGNPASLRPTLLLPVSSRSSRVGGWLLVEQNDATAEPGPDDVVYLEEVIKIVLQKVREIRYLEELRQGHRALMQKNVALKEIMEHIEEEKGNIKRQVADNIEQVLMPALNKMMRRDGTANPYYYELLGDGLKELAHSSGDILRLYSRLSPREIEICNMIKQGSTSKEIAQQLYITLATVKKHREIIRKKLGINNKSINLTTFLKSL